MKWILLLTFPVFCLGLPDISLVEQDLFIPAVTEGNPEAGKLVKQQLPKYKGTKVHHLLFLPRNFKPNKEYDVIIEYPGNGPYKNQYGDISSGKVDGCALGYGISGEKDYIWLSLPFISKDGKSNQLKWWGDREATVNYCKEVVNNLKKDFKTRRFILTGFSRGSIACNYIGLADDEIASLWSAFICYSHYDGVREWNYKGSNKDSAKKRLKRLKGRPQFIIMENHGNKNTEKFLNAAYPNGNFTFVDLPYRNHNSSWVLRPTQERRKVRQWLKGVLKKD